MTKPQLELWRKLEQFEIDDRSASFSFSHRLAQEHGWTLSFARRVVAEYRRFVFLCLAAGHPCTPSEQVDEAWHLHLVYTRSYWQDFCDKTLGQPLHHGPTNGGAMERTKHIEWYLDTLASYRNFFGEPPRDIWPDVEMRFGDDLRSRRINTARHWIIPKPDVDRWIRVIAAPGALAVLLAGCAGGPLGLGSIFNLPGPQFLEFYGAGFAVATIGGLVYLSHWERKQKQRAETERVPSDIYALAGMAGGAERIAQASVASLLGMKAFAVSGTPEISLEARGPVPSAATVVESGVYRDLTGQGKIEIRHAVKVAAKTQVVIDLMAQVEGKQRCPIYGLIPLALLICAGMVKVAVGVSRDRPVLFLILLLLASFATLFFMEAKRRSARTWQERLADQVSKHPRGHFNQLKATGQPLHDGSYFAVVAAAAGAAALAGGELDSFARPFLPPIRKAIGETSHTSDSGSGGCGGGGDGGGGGGGGCGGCSGH